eukprot:369832_1
MGCCATKLQSENSPYQNMDDRMEAVHSKNATNSAHAKDNTLSLTDTRKLLKRLTENEVPSDNEITKSKLEIDNDDMISSEHLREVIIDLINTHNAQPNVEIVMVNEVLRKWESNLSSLYSQLIEEYKCNINQDDIHRLTNEFKIGKKLKRGAYICDIKIAQRLKDKNKKLFAAKMINKQNLIEWDLIALRSEIEIMRDLKHENIVELFDVFESPNEMCLIFELLEGGQLFDVIIDKGSFSEHVAAQYFAQLCDAMKYIHSKNIIHRNIKPENLMFNKIIKNKKNMEKNNLKLIDFQVSEKLKDGIGYTKYYSDAEYTAPEIHKAYLESEIDIEYKYFPAMDMWSCGCILYALLVGYPPFTFSINNNLSLLRNSIINDDVCFHSQHWN